MDASSSSRVDYVARALEAAREGRAPPPTARLQRDANVTLSLPRLLTVLTVMLTLTVGLHYYLWTRLVRDPALPGPWYGLVTVALIVFAALIPVGMVLSRAAPRAIASPVMWVVYTWMGVMFFLFVLSLPADVGRVLYGWLQRVPLDADRRQFVARVASTLVAFGAVGIAGAGFLSVMRPVGVKTVRVRLPKFPAALDGYRIVQLTDIHVGPTIGREFIDAMVAETNALEPDLIAITGDLVDGSVAELGELVASLAHLRARDGVFFVTGNHEYYSGVDSWIAHLESLGIRVLRNERVSIRGEAGFDLAGVDDWTAAQFGNGHGMTFERIVEGRDPARALILLAHQPKAVLPAEQHGVDFQLSGHTHGGQLFPFNYLVRLQQPYNAGLYSHGRARLYVSRGTGYWGPPMRVGAPAEITRIEISRGT